MGISGQNTRQNWTSWEKQPSLSMVLAAIKAKGWTTRGTSFTAQLHLVATQSLVQNSYPPHPPPESNCIEGFNNFYNKWAQVGSSA